MWVARSKYHWFEASLFCQEVILTHYVEVYLKLMIAKWCIESWEMLGKYQKLYSSTEYVNAFRKIWVDCGRSKFWEVEWEQCLIGYIQQWREWSINKWDKLMSSAFAGIREWGLSHVWMNKIKQFREIRETEREFKDF